ncbi:MAG TPA: hypothetical protein VH062_16085 [Polyangiaceae bacterium]|jgi:hypothetical protein|nr:hypothetical protein [Polyangiaceae bacterium]
MTGAIGPGSAAPATPEERDALLRRVPELTLVPELAGLRFPAERVLGGVGADHTARITELADPAWLARLRDALARLAVRANDERDGGLGFLAASLGHFVTALPPARHPLVVALYFASPFTSPAEHLDAIARAMDDHESALPPHVVENSPAGR